MFNEREASSERCVCGGCAACRLVLPQAWLAAVLLVCGRARAASAPVSTVRDRNLAALGALDPIWRGLGKKWNTTRTRKWLVAEATGSLRSPLYASRVPVARAQSTASCDVACPAPCTARGSRKQRKRRERSITAAHAHRTDAVDALPGVLGSQADQRSSPKYGNQSPWPTSWPRRPRRL